MLRNGATVSLDMRRRSVFCDLFTEVERAEDRVFERELEVAEILEMRSDILGALYAMAKEWHEAMQPRPSRVNSGFPEWSRIIGGIVEHSGYGSPVGVPSGEFAPDEDGVDMRALVALIAAGSAGRPVRFEEVENFARENGLSDRFIPETGQLDAKCRAGFACLLKSYDGRMVGAHRLRLDGRGRGRRYRLEEVTTG